MKTPSSLKRVALTAIALAVLAGSVGTTAALAADNSRGRNKDRNQRQERTVRQQKPERARKNDRAVRSNDRGKERRDDRAVRGREGDRSVRGRDNDRDRDRDHDRDRIVIRDRDRRNDRSQDRYDRQHRVVVRHRDLRACPPPRYVVRPWYRDVRRIYVHDDPFYFHAGLGIYLGGLALRLELGDAPPEGFVFYDPYCDMEFWSVSEYHRHLRYHRHQNALTVIVLDGYYLDD